MLTSKAIQQYLNLLARLGTEVAIAVHALDSVSYNLMCFCFSHNDFNINCSVPIFLCLNVLVRLPTPSLVLVCLLVLIYSDSSYHETTPPLVPWVVLLQLNSQDCIFVLFVWLFDSSLTHKTVSLFVWLFASPVYPLLHSHCQYCPNLPTWVNMWSSINIKRLA